MTVNERASVQKLYAQVDIDMADSDTQSGWCQHEPPKPR